MPAGYRKDEKITLNHLAMLNFFKENCSLNSVELFSACRCPLREKSPYSEFFWSVFCRIRTKKTQNTDTFYAEAPFAIMHFFYF